MRRLVSLAIVCALLGLALPLRAETARPLQVVASFSILADMLREVAGDAAQVHSLVGANADAHVFEPTPADAQRLARADLVVVNGLHFEGWIDRLVRSSGYRGPVIEATRGIEPRRVGRAVDPHAWQSLAHAQRYVENMRAALVAAAPSQAAAINARAAAYRERIAALDASARAAFEAVPRDQRRVVTTHDAFGYLGDAYGITFISPRSWNTDSEASAAGVASVIRQVRLHQARALFVENITDRRSIERIAQETGARVGGTLYSDALSPPAAGADTYLRLYAHNVKSIAVALQAVAAR
ncbi:MAG TPA: zinc ABC transporter substrate-binding protein [Piscinibacter sp.]|jgi:zinc/manganese transport system substrate-binding protein|nr:zinc ABC transporter substrate-binding protein [Piscinibacter sp.]HNW63921.1 zinc ABC transporter substrate-binding protein [Piscinibacter sp.]HOY36259.1 zinc ABC transporter substrate-binding protein [Piscinibacter sp.]HPG79607.1 zinc ABC transporter substrate-binding protein [Piscinibacter sp.]HPM67396.1 zinc ABC transporter substrate-binding protein [Piscinibacter sp.]